MNILPGNDMIYLTTGLFLGSWAITRHRHADTLFPAPIADVDVIFGEILFALVLSTNLVFILAPGVLFLYTGSVPDWTNPTWLRLAAVLGALAIAAVSYNRLVSSISAD